MGKKTIICRNCGKTYDNKPLIRQCENGCDWLLMTGYLKKEFLPSDKKNIFKFLDWLPFEGQIETSIGPVVYKSEKLGKKLGLANLYISFNGYWPDIGAFNMTGTFKDYEALPTMMMFIESGEKRLILSSAGNTGRAFAYAATLLDVDTYIVIPGRMLDSMWLPDEKILGRIHLIVLKDSFDYFSAIRLGDRLSREHGIPSEGGAKNVARRDGMATVMLEATRVIGSLPSYYFQAVGSGTGAIAVYEACLRLQEAPGFPMGRLPVLNLVQNAPFAPIHHAWEDNEPIPPPEESINQVEQIAAMHGRVLANRNPPYYIGGGVRDVLAHTGGRTYKITNNEAVEAGKLFEEVEGIDILPEAAICVAALIKAVKKGSVPVGDIILVNITGGGTKRIKTDYHCRTMEPEFVVEDLSGFRLPL